MPWCRTGLPHRKRDAQSMDVIIRASDDHPSAHRTCPSPRAATSSKTTVVVKQLEDAAALDFFLTDNRVCWSEIKLAVIKCSDVDPKKKGRVEKVNIILKQTYDKLQIALLTGTIIWDITKINPLCLLKRCIFSSFSSI